MFDRAVKFKFIVTIVFIFWSSSATIVQKCGQDGDENVIIDNRVFISGCDRPPCQITKNVKYNIEMIFIPDYDVNRLRTSVYAWIYAIPLPYLPVDGLTACNNLYLASTGAKTSCPIKKGQRYLYKNTVEVKGAYPKVKVVLHWALVDARNNANVFCFEIPVKIVNETKSRL